MSVLAALLLAAQEPTVPWEFQMSFHEENDTFGLKDRTDQHYTQGLRYEVMWRHSREKGPPAEPPGEGIVAVRLFDDDPRSIVSNGVAVGHNMYTPVDIRSKVCNPDDQPWAAWLYLGFIVRELNESKDREDTYELDLGMVGPAALGEPIQSFVHEVINSPQPGWPCQLPNEFTAMLSWDRRWVYDIKRIGDSLWKIRSSPHFGARLGNVFTNVGMGLKLLAGYNPPKDYSSGGVLAAARSFGSEDPGEETSDWSAYGFIGVDGRAEAYNVFLDGTLVHPSESINRNPLVSDFITGLKFRWKVCFFSYSNIFRSPEIEGDTRFHNYGSLELGLSFPF